MKVHQFSSAVPEPNKVSVIERCPYERSNREEGPCCAQIIFTDFLCRSLEEGKVRTVKCGYNCTVYL